MGKKKPKKGSIAAADPTKTGKDTQGKSQNGCKYIQLSPTVSMGLLTTFRIELFDTTFIS